MSGIKCQTFRYDSDAFPRLNLLQRRLQDFPKVNGSFPSVILQMPCIRVVCDRGVEEHIRTNNGQFSVKGILGDFIEEKDVIECKLIVTLCILKPDKCGKLTSKDMELLKLIKDIVPDIDIKTVVFAVDTTECTFQMLEKCSKKVSEYFDHFSSINTIFNRLFPIKSTEIAVRISLFLERSLLRELPVKLIKTEGLEQLTSPGYYQVFGNILKNGPLKEDKCQDILRRNAFEWKLDCNVTHTLSWKKVKVTSFQNYLCESISNEIALVLQEKLNEKLRVDNMNLADEFGTQPVLTDSMVLFVSKVINSKIVAKLGSYPDLLCSVDVMDARFRQMIADEIHKNIMERRDELVQAVLSKFGDVYLEYMKMSDIINVFAERNKFDICFHEYKTITERNLLVKACGLFGKIIKIYIQKEVHDEASIRSYLLQYNEDISIVNICEYQEMTTKKHTLMSGIKVTQSESFPARYGTVSFALQDEKGQYYCATCKHVIEGSSSLNIETDDGYLFCTKLFYCSEDVDFALLKLQNTNVCGSHGIRHGKNEFIPGELLENDMMPNENDTVYKWGATTGRTNGKYIGVLCTRKLENGNFDIETFIIEGLDEHFSKEGDSGSLVCIKPDSVVYTSHMAAFILIGELEQYDGNVYVNTHVCYRVSIPLMEMKKHKACSNIKPCF
ncbi:uncharacterized protein LOC127709660 [Mytilus californianus]|uniref:uncharacterized protein LOC127709660 n=1 Tax=Mytilus californianus TaxID=6549 RepID=UPI002246DB78|nr:uncharacterized protein LOC127709660 [Mytilus californianus]